MKQKLQFLMTVIATVMFGSISMAQCPGGQMNVTVDVTTDTWGYETYWEVTPTGNACGVGTIMAFANAGVVGCLGGGGQVATGADPGAYAPNTTITENVGCLATGSCFDIHYADDWGDGGSSFQINLDGVPTDFFANPGIPSTGAIHTFCVSACPAGEGELTVEFTTDTWAHEGYFELTPVGDACGTNTVASYGNTIVGCLGSGAQVAADTDPGAYTVDNSLLSETIGCFAIGTCFDLHYVDDYDDTGMDFVFSVDGVEIANISGLSGDGVTVSQICVTTQPALDLRVDSVGIGTYYSMVPLVQASALTFDATMLNFGTSDVTDAMVTATVNDGTSDVATATSTAVATLASGTFSSGALTPGYTPVGMGLHTISFVSSMTELDEDISNNSMAMSVLVNDSVLGRSNDAATGSLGFGTGAADGARLGTQFGSPTTDNLTSVSAFFNGPTAGDSTKFSVYDMSGGIPNAVVASTGTYVFTAADDSAGVFLTMSLDAPYTVAAGSDFVVVAHEYGNNVTLATDNSSLYEATTNWLISTAVTTDAWDNGESFGFGLNFVMRANFSSSVSIGENALNTANVYPNPTNGIVNIELTEEVSDASIVVYSVDGTIVSTDVVSGAQFSVNLEGLSKGIYIIELNNGSNTGVYRIVKD